MQLSAIPPVRKQIRVAAVPDRAFKIFTGGMHLWWPRCSGERSDREAIVVEPRVGGRWFERAKSGVESDWGCVVAWDPPLRVVFGWQMEMDNTFNPALMTEVEIRFDPVGDDSTLVSLEHRNLERYGVRAEDAVEKYNGPSAWVGVLKAFETFSSSPPGSSPPLYGTQQI